MLHTVKTTCAISALLVSFAATAHAANVVSDPYASYIDCSYNQAKNFGNSGCTVRGQQVTVGALSQMMAAANAYSYEAVANYNYNATLNAGDEAYNIGGERGTVRYERGVDGNDREVKRLVFFVGKPPKDRDAKTPRREIAEGSPRQPQSAEKKDLDTKTPRREVAEGNLRQPQSAEIEGPAYKIELSNTAATQIEKAIVHKKERDEKVPASSRLGMDSPQARGGDSTGKMEVVASLNYASAAEIKAEEAKIAQAGSAIVSASDTATVTSVKAVNIDQQSELKVMLVYNTQATDVVTVTLRVFDASTTETIYATTVRADEPVIYHARTISVPVTQSLAQGGTSVTPGENVRDQINSGSINTSPFGGVPAEPMDKDNPDSGMGGLGTFK